jgi:hypothetical protein
MATIKPTIPIERLNMSGLYKLVKRQILSDQIRNKTQLNAVHRKHILNSNIQID